MGIFTCINSFETIWKLPDRCDMLQRNGIWWLADSFMAESFKHLICSRIRVFHSSMSNGSPWHAKPACHQSRKLPIMGKGKPNKDRKHLFNKTSRSIVSCKLIGRIRAGLRGEFRVCPGGLNCSVCVRTAVHGSLFQLSSSGAHYGRVPSRS